jgi:hypothetical protein
MSAMTYSDDSLSLILRRLDEIERKLDRIMEGYGPQRPSAIRHAVAVFQGRTEGLNEQIFGADKQVFGWGQSD